jgi:DNA-binding transcriptional LysR family regulator
MPWHDRIKRTLKLRDLDILMAVVQTGAMGRAAVRLHMSQPAVSKAIADLEHTFGVRLLHRSRRGAEPTPYGAALVKRGFAVFDEVRRGVEEDGIRPRACSRRKTFRSHAARGRAHPIRSRSVSMRRGSI